MSVLFFFLFTSLSTYAEAPQAETESEKECKKLVELRFDSIKQFQESCRWELPRESGTGKEKDRSVGHESQCSAWETVGNVLMKRKSEFKNNEYKGTLVCGDTRNAVNQSYVKESPVFAYQCSQCSSNDPSGGVDETCFKSMYDESIANCKGNPKMKYDHKQGKSIHRESGEVIP